MTKVVINNQYGGFSLSRKALHALRAMNNKYALEETDIGEKWKDTGEVRTGWSDSFLRDIPRDDPDLIKVVQKLKTKADGMCARLKIVTIPDDVKWEIEEYDGLEWVSEIHSTWS